jgi:hypothetical protein
VEEFCVLATRPLTAFVVAPVMISGVVSCIHFLSFLSSRLLNVRGFFFLWSFLLLLGFASAGLEL